MTLITAAYKERSPETQHFFGEPVEILNIVADRYGQFDDEAPDHLKWAVITLWQYGRFPSNEAIYWLQIFQHISAEQLIGNSDEFMRAYVSAERSRAEGRAA